MHSERTWRVGLNAAISVVAILFAVYVMVVLAKRNVSLVQELGAARQVFDSAPLASGALAGWSALDSSEWFPEPSGESFGVLFVISATSGTGSARFWREAADRLRAAAPSAQLVGLCVADELCEDSAEPTQGLVVLRAMDPAFVHNLTKAAEDGRAFVFRGARVVGSIELSAHVDDVVRQIAFLTGQATAGVTGT
jgi:hypothetical protein